MPFKCIVCSSSLPKVNRTSKNTMARYSCPRCGTFQLSASDGTNTVIEKLNSSERAKLSYSIRKMQNSNECPRITRKILCRLLSVTMPTPSEQADLLIRWLARNIGEPGDVIAISSSALMSVIGAKSPAGFALVAQHLVDSGLIAGKFKDSVTSQVEAMVTLTFDGWKYFDTLRQTRTSYRKAFMAMKFSDRNLDQVVNDAFRPAVEKTGFRLLRIDDLPVAGLIDDRLRVEIQTSDFMIADLTHDNQNVYWEAGYAEGLRVPVIYTCERTKFKETQTFFDTNHHLTIKWDSSSLNEAEESLKATIRASLPQLAKMSDNSD